MGIIRRQFLDIIQWEDNSADTIVYKAPIDANQIQNGSTLIVQPGQIAIFRVFDGSRDSGAPLNTLDQKYNQGLEGIDLGVEESAAGYVKGKTMAAEIFKPGTYQLNTGVVPILSDLMGFARGFQSNIKAFVYFVSLKNFLGMKWGAPGGVQLIDVNFGDVLVQAYGTFSFKITNPDMFTKNISGTDEHFTIRDMERLDTSDPNSAKNPIKSLVCSCFADAIGEAYGNVIDITILQSKKREVARLLKEIVNEQLSNDEWGLQVNSIVIETIKLPDSVQQRLNERTAVNVQGGFNAARSITSMETMRKMGNNASGCGIGGMFAQAGMGAAMGRQMGAAMNEGFDPATATNLDAEAKAAQQARLNAYGQQNARQSTPQPSGNFKCSCGYSSENQFKFCPECGQKAPEKAAPKFCPECGTKNGDGSKFCQECGNKF